MNIVVTIADDQRHSALGCCDAPTADKVETPHLDRLAAEGVRFTHAYHAGSPVGAVCMPSRAMLHSGRGGHDLPPDLCELPAGLECCGAASDRLLGERLREVGYRCHAVGKWHNGQRSLLRSFESVDSIFLSGMGDHFNLPLYEMRDGQLDAAGTSMGVHATEVFSTAAERFLRRWVRTGGARPFFLYVAFSAPHDPRRTHRQWHDRYPADQIGLPPNFLPQHPFDNGALDLRDEWLTPVPRNREQTQHEIAEYYAMVEHLDHGVGRIRRCLSELGLADETLFVHTSDHGLSLGQHGLMGKQNLYDSSVRVPLLMAGPGVSQGGVARGLCYQHDLYPTLLEAGGASADDETPYRSLWSALRDPDAPLRAEVRSYYGVNESQKMVSDGRTKRIRYEVGGHTFEQTFDLVSDPWEMHGTITN